MTAFKLHIELSHDILKAEMVVSPRGDANDKFNKAVCERNGTQDSDR